MISKSESPSSRVFMRMSLSSKSGRWRATSTSASSPLFANVASKPSRVKTSHSNSHATANSDVAAENPLRAGADDDLDERGGEAKIDRAEAREEGKREPQGGKAPN